MLGIGDIPASAWSTWRETLKRDLYSPSEIYNLIAFRPQFRRRTLRRRGRAGCRRLTFRLVTRA